MAGGKVNLGPTVGPKVFTKAFLRKEREEKARSKCVLRLPQPKVFGDFHTPDVDARKDLMLHMDTRGVNMNFIREQQDK